MRGRLPLVLFLVITAVSIAAGVRLSGGGQPAVAADSQPPFGDLPGATTITLPDDDVSLRAASRDRASRAALADPRVRSALVGHRTAVVLVRALAPYERDAVCACIAVTIYDYTADRALDALVDPGSWRVRSVGPTPGRPPLSAHEVRLAHRIAEEDPRTRTLVGAGRHGHPALASPMWPGGGPCDEGRCASVIFLLDGLGRSELGRQLHVLIDLSSRAVLARSRLRCEPECAPGW